MKPIYNPRALRSTVLAAAVALACGTAAAQQDPMNDTDRATDDPMNPYQNEQPLDPAQPTDPMSEPQDQPGQYPSQPQDQYPAPQEQPGQYPSQQDQPGQYPSEQDETDRRADQMTRDNETVQGEQSRDWGAAEDQTTTAGQGSADQGSADQGSADQGSWDKQQNAANQAGSDTFSQQFGEDNDLTEFVAALESAGLAKALSDGTQYTVFAPTDEAFKKFKEEQGADWSAAENTEQLREVLRSHVVVDSLDKSELENLDSAKVLTGSVVEISNENGELKIGDAKVTGEPITTAGNITIYKIDQVIDPSTLSEQSASTQGASDQTASEQTWGATTDEQSAGTQGASDQSASEQGWSGTDEQRAGNRDAFDQSASEQSWGEQESDDQSASVVTETPPETSRDTATTDRYEDTVEDEEEAEE